MTPQRDFIRSESHPVETDTIHARRGTRPGNARSGYRAAAFFVLCLAFGELASLAAIEIAAGSFIRFQMAAYLAVAARLGPLPALALAAALLPGIVGDAGNPSALVAYGIEAIVVGLARSRDPKRGLVPIVGIYWPLLGLPLLGIAYSVGQDVSREAIQFSLLKAWLNALLDAAMAGMVADSPLVDRLLGEGAPTRVGMGKYLKIRLSTLALSVVFVAMLASAQAFRSYTEGDIALRVRSGLARAAAYFEGRGTGDNAEALLPTINALLSVREEDFSGRYELASVSPSAWSVQPWGEGMFVRESTAYSHPIDRWRNAEYYGELSTGEPRLRYVVSFGFAFRGMYHFYVSVFAIALAFLYGFYLLVFILADSLARRLSALDGAAKRLPERIASGEDPAWPAMDIEELASLSDAFRAVSLRLRSLFSELRGSEGRLEATVAERTAQLERRTEELRSLLARVEGEREEERARIARELHDELGQDIASLGMALYVLERRAVGIDGTVSGKLADMRELLVRLSEDMRRLVADLRPSALDRLGLVEALCHLAEESASRTGLRIELERGFSPEFFPSDALKIALYRIAQESLSNAIRHSGSPWVTLRLREDDGAVLLEVEDGGRGFDARAVAAGRRPTFGLVGMRERCRALGGDFSVFSVPGRGTLVSARFPKIKEG